MARISGVDLPNEKRLEIGLTYIYGIGRETSKRILEATGLDGNIRVKDLNENDVAKLRDYIEKNIAVEGDLRKEVQLNIKGLIEINSYRGVRHRKHLPCRGQRTRSNARTLKGPRASSGSRKKKGGNK